MHHRWHSVLLVLALLVAVTLPLGCAAADSNPKSGPDGDATGPTTTGSPSDLEALKSAAANAYSGEPWWGHITEWREIHVLGAATIVVVTDYDATSPDTSDDRSAIAPAIAELQSTFAHNVEVRGLGQGTQDPAFVQLGAVSSGGTPMSEAFDLPPAPETAEELRAWMQSVYGEGGMIELGADETWYGSITGYSYEIPEGMTEALLVVRTSMTKDDIDAEDMQYYRLQRAIQATGSPLLSFYAVLGPDDELLVGSSGTAAEPGTGGPQY